jgi:hypothetical protein
MVFFDDNFEGAGVASNAPPSGWVFGEQSSFPDGVVHCSFSTDQAHSGTISLKLDYTSCCDPDNFDACSLDRAIEMPNVSEIYIRAWRLGINYGLNPINYQNKNLYLHSSWTQGNFYPDFVLGQFDGYLGSPGMQVVNSKDCFANDNGGDGPYVPDCFTTQNVGNNNPFPQPLYQDGVWYCMEWHIKLNSVSGGVTNQDGLIEGWVNGTQVLGFYNLAMRAASDQMMSDGWLNGPTAVFGPFSIYRQSALPGSILYWDDVAAGDERIGCGGGVDNPTTPNDPTNSP